MTEFSSHYDTTIRHLESALSDLIDSGSEFDIERRGDVLNIEFDDGEKFVITPQAPTEQIWISANYAGYRFNQSGDEWVNEKDGEELMAFLSRIIGEKLGTDITL